MKRHIGSILLVFAGCAPAAIDRSAPATAPTTTASASEAWTTVSASATPSASTAAVAKPSKEDLPPSPPLAAVPIAHRLAADDFQSCAVRADGAVVCWGSGTVHPRPDSDKVVTTPIKPVVVAGVSDAKEVALGYQSACALRKNGTIACWGVGFAPNGLALDRQKAIDVTGLPKASRLATMQGGMCAFAGSELVCFSFAGAAPTKKALPVPADDVVDAAGDGYQSCIVTNKGAVWCWGENDYNTKKKDDPFFRVTGIDDAIATTAHLMATCIVHATGYRSCWGSHHPLPRSYDKDAPPIVLSKAMNDVSRAALGDTTCWLLRDRRVKCEGKGDYGQHGDGSSSSYGRAPVSGLVDAVEIVVGKEHACALRANDEVVCWGANDRGQVGDGLLVDRTVPTPVIGLGGKEPPPPPKPGTGTKVVAPIVKGPKAPWREADGTSKRTHNEGSYWGGWHSPRNLPSAYGTKAALFQKEGLAVHDDHGVVGPIVWPKDTKVLALDGDDVVWAGTKDALLRANDVLAAKKTGFQKVLAVPYAVDFAATKGMVVAATAGALHVSKDSGKTFTKLVPKVDITISDVMARADGLIAIVGKDAAGETALYLAKDGVTFVRSVFQAPSVSQVGTHIYAGGCPGGILSSDGATWNAWDHDYGAPLSISGWGSALEKSSRPSIFEAFRQVRLSDPPAPAPSAKSVTGAPGKCSGGGGLGVGGGGRSSRRGGACLGVACIRASLGELPSGTATDLAFYADGACDRDPKGTCNGPWRRRPHVWSSASDAPLDLPNGCEPKRLLAAGGIAILFCEKDKTTSLYTIGKEGVFKAEGTVPSFDVDEITIGDDGTIVAHPRCGEKGQGVSGSCPGALVRSPVALGSAKAWRTTDVPRSLAYRVLGGGDVLVIAGIEGDSQSFALIVDRANKPLQTFVPKVTLNGDLIEFDMQKDRIVITQQITSRKELAMMLVTDGLAPLPPPPPK